MSSAQVLLGLTPTILAVLGPSTDELSVLTVVAQRPGLATLLALGSPSVHMGRAFEHRDPLSQLRERKGRLRQWKPQGWKRWVFAGLQYALAWAAVANIATLNWQLGLKTVCAFWSETIVAPLIWGVLAVPIHILGTLIFRLQVRRVHKNEQAERINFKRWLYGTLGRAKRLFWTEPMPSASQEDLYVMVFEERRLLVSLMWMLSPCIIAHIIFGTLLLSSLTFIGPRDAIAVVGRYMSSVLVCRALLMHEIAGLRECFNSENGGEVSALLPISSKPIEPWGAVEVLQPKYEVDELIQRDKDYQLCVVSEATDSSSQIESGIYRSESVESLYDRRTGYCSWETRHP
ncbi:hypothetical protein F5Y15DRAFT_366118 [Xylariaceae sp. FL0016]|nr:hypothetical protein F5Y15DRAFT_366118 [Xylariaceae sp. FL0016]